MRLDDFVAKFRANATEVVEHSTAGSKETGGLSAAQGRRTCCVSVAHPASSQHACGVGIRCCRLSARWRFDSAIVAMTFMSAARLRAGSKELCATKSQACRRWGSGDVRASCPTRTLRNLALARNFKFRLPPLSGSCLAPSRCAQWQRGVALKLAAQGVSSRAAPPSPSQITWQATWGPGQRSGGFRLPPLCRGGFQDSRPRHAIHAGFKVPPGNRNRHEAASGCRACRLRRAPHKPGHSGTVEIHSSASGGF